MLQAISEAREQVAAWVDSQRQVRVRSREGNNMRYAVQVSVLAIEHDRLIVNSKR